LHLEIPPSLMMDVRRSTIKVCRVGKKRRCHCVCVCGSDSVSVCKCVCVCV
jgi:hypothetical protein